MTKPTTTGSQAAEWERRKAAEAARISAARRRQRFEAEPAQAKLAAAAPPPPATTAPTVQPAPLGNPYAKLAAAAVDLALTAAATGPGPLSHEHAMRLVGIANAARDLNVTPAEPSRRAILGVLATEIEGTEDADTLVAALCDLAAVALGIANRQAEAVALL